MSKDKFKEFREKKAVINTEDTNEKKLVSEDIKKHIKNFIVQNTELSDESLISLVVLHETEVIEDDKCLKELIDYGFINESKAITESGISFIKDKTTIDRLIYVLGE